MGYDFSCLHESLHWTAHWADQRNKLFSVSDIPPPIRKYVHPIKLNGTQIIENGVYIIVDDLISTACTLSSAQQVLISESNEIKILAVSLFSPVNNRIKEAWSDVHTNIY